MASRSGLQTVRDRGFAQRQMVEILKAVARGARVLIMDEPTSSLTMREERRSSRIIAELKARGIGHHLYQPSHGRDLPVRDRHQHGQRRPADRPARPGATTIGRPYRRPDVARRRARPSAPAAVAAPRPAARPALEVRGPAHRAQAARLSFSVGPGRGRGPRRAGRQRPLDARQGAVRPAAGRARARSLVGGRAAAASAIPRRAQSRPRLRAGGSAAGRSRARPGAWPPTSRCPISTGSGRGGGWPIVSRQRRPIALREIPRPARDQCARPARPPPKTQRRQSAEGGLRQMARDLAERAHP